MAHLTHDLEQSTESRKRRLTPAELCSLWRSAPYKLAFNELTQEVELDEASLPVVEIEEAYIGLSEKDYSADPRTTFDSVLKVARERRFHPVQEYFKWIEKDDSITPIELSTFSRDYFGTSDGLYDSM
jgi:predicted P-loop ATPase